LPGPYVFRGGSLDTGWWFVRAASRRPVGCSGRDFSGIVDTHNPFTPLEIALLAVLFSAAVRQRYRTTVYAWLRQPAIAALLLAVFYPFLYIISTVLSPTAGWQCVWITPWLVCVTLAWQWW